ncbi:hypothetical protein BS47DRAFT_1366193 [Hydnum rufescens UP504]|uniref:Uncharacterized protein n=1 Tax=Hydnum rufescens UP504 TaxID=1448309 RepID=A0A9P6DR58_9AGAM|nr:hypothetical protein BS47DRAFT_1366193 [Hydnum rufescens UP504]
MSEPLPPCDSIPLFLVLGNLAKWPLGVWYTQLVNLTHDESPPYTAFKLATIFHWECFEKFKHEGLMLVFEQNPHSVVYLHIDHMLFENDPWHASKESSVNLVPKSSRGSPQAVKDQEDAEHEGRAADWCQPLDGDMIKRSSKKNSLLQSLGMTHFQVVDTCPNLFNVILAMYAISMQQ